MSHLLSPGRARLRCPRGSTSKVEFCAYLVRWSSGRPGHRFLKAIALGRKETFSAQLPVCVLPGAIGSNRPLHNRNLHSRRNPHQNGVMRTQVKTTIAVLLCGLPLSVSWPQEEPRQLSIIRQGANSNHGRNSDRTLSPDDRLSVIAAALDSRVRLYTKRDCSHLVHAIYERAGFPYAYASSSDLYVGVKGFQRVTRPQPGDLVVWRGHVGIVIRPARHVFFSFMRAGPGIDDYETPYWTSRGHARFYHYVKE
jgi:hypothetical protein